MNDIPMDANQIFTDGSKNDDICTGSGTCAKSHKHEIKIQKKDPDFCYIFRCELIQIDEELEVISSLSPTKEVLILTDSKSFFFYT